ncbi:MAG: hypothetical protein ACTHJJ_08340 [Intrasporangium sp.]|uniref:hypothetical protein n=1 Tax=Intrasporangium sp. TaxID=1925024 RepID=UPI003F7DFBE2
MQFQATRRTATRPTSWSSPRGTGHVFPTLEVVLEEPPATLRKRAHPDPGLALIDLAEG